MMLFRWQAVVTHPDRADEVDSFVRRRSAVKRTRALNRKLAAEGSLAVAYVRDRELEREMAARRPRTI